ncbi:DUF262 domain-containing protein [Rhizobium leguminosarum]
MAIDRPFGLFKVSQHQTKTLIWWFNNRNLIDMSPPYQRKGRLWSSSDKAYLIDSILNGFDIPKLYLADFQYKDSVLNMSRLPYAIIDGKQRFEAVFDFFENRLVLNPDFVWRKDPSLKLGGLSLRDIRKSYPPVAEAFDNESWDIMSVIAENEDDINDLFVRLNRSKTLTGAEIRNAMIGPVTDITRKVADHPFFEENIRFSTKRAGDLNAAAKVLMFEYYDKLMSTKKNDLDKFAQEKNLQPDRLELAGRRSLDTLTTMQEVFLPRDPLLSSSGLFPVYYWIVRELGGSEIVPLREFLVSFEKERKENRESQKVTDDLDNELSRFDTLNRSTNDLGSHSGRVQILLSRYRAWLKNTIFG